MCVQYDDVDMDVDMYVDVEDPQERCDKRGAAYTRKQRSRAIARKLRICRGYDKGRPYYGMVDGWTRGGEYGRLSKGKIHCSCWMCRSKSYDGLKHSDKKKILNRCSEVDF